MRREREGGWNRRGNGRGGVGEGGGGGGTKPAMGDSPSHQVA